MQLLVEMQLLVQVWGVTLAQVVMVQELEMPMVEQLVGQELEHLIQFQRG